MNKKSDSLHIDELRHKKLEDRFGYKSKANWIFNLHELSVITGFEKNHDLFYWLAKEKVRYNGLYPHNFIGVASPYNLLFNSICKYIDKNYDYAIANTLNKEHDKIYSELSSWIRDRKFEEDCNISRKAILIQKEKEIHESAVKKKEEKATQNLFNAIRRKDIKAIISLRSKGADINIKNEQVVTALKYAESLNDKNLVNSLVIDLVILKNKYLLNKK